MYEPSPREGTETGVWHIDPLDNLWCMNHLPVRGRKRFYPRILDAVRYRCVYEPSPREGTETLPARPADSTAYQLQCMNHLPVRGRKPNVCVKTFNSVVFGKCMNHLPVRGRKLGEAFGVDELGFDECMNHRPVRGRKQSLATFECLYQPRFLYQPRLVYEPSPREGTETLCSS